MLKVATGYFDPLLAEHAGRLASIRDRADALMVVVATPPRPILSGAARAQLVAALSVVDYVVFPEKTAVEELLAKIRASEVLGQELEDARLTRDLIQHVRSRQHAS